MKGNFHVRFWSSGRGSDLPVDCNKGNHGKTGARTPLLHPIMGERWLITRPRKGMKGTDNVTRVGARPAEAPVDALHSRSCASSAQAKKGSSMAPLPFYADTAGCPSRCPFGALSYEA